ncbi:MAG: site-specific DNA-methyltransferase [Armatimonadetes bacterium]|nr:site-specific DNA-methyltransferase [Armatimonadota bacterium]
MPELDFKGKEFVRNHHLTVPYRPLVPDAGKSLGKPDLDGNLIIHGDNLEALKALLPKYAGKVDCIFIDPPYNTGNEGWCYNDNVNSPMLKAWFSENPVGVDDGLRHDKWCCMMWPRLKLLWELLAEHGGLWMTLDDNEFHRARSILDELFGGENAIATIVWHKMDSPRNTAEFFSTDQDYLLCVAKSASAFQVGSMPRTSEMLARYQNPDNDPRGVWLLSDLAARNYYAQGLYEIVLPSGGLIKGPPKGSYWRISKQKFEALAAENRIYFGKDGNARPGIKRFLTDVRSGVVPQTLWHWETVGSTRNAKQELHSIFSDVDQESIFVTPKPSRLLDRVLNLATSGVPEAIILDSFAGSGTTAHAVLKLNAQDGGNRKFILVECEDYADALTAERVRRVIDGYPFKGNQRKTLYEKKLTWTELKKGEHLKQEAENTKKMYEADWDDVKITMDDGALKVIGERKIEETAPGLGGSFTYCTLGPPLKLDEMLKGKGLPSREALGDWLLYVAGTGGRRDKAPKLAKGIDPHFLAKQGCTYYWFLYKPDKEWLKSPESALTLDLARAIAKVDPKAEHRVFAPQKFVSNKLLRAEGLRIEFAPIPLALFRRGAE